MKLEETTNYSELRRKIFFFQDRHILNFPKKNDLKKKKTLIIQIQNVVKQAKENLTPECYQIVLFFYGSVDHG